MTLQKYEAWLAIHAERNTVQAYISRLSPFFEKHTFANEKQFKEEIFSFLSEQNCAAATVNLFLAACRSFSKFAGYQIKLDNAKLKQKIPKTPTQEEMRHLLCELKSNRKTTGQFRTYALVCFLYATGCRISEALGFKKEPDEALKVYRDFYRSREKALS